MCKLFKVSRSCYYNWIDKGCIVNKIDKELNELVKKIFEQARATYGTRRLKEVLKQRYGLIVSRRKIQRTAYIGILEQCFQNYLNTFCKNIF